MRVHVALRYFGALLPFVTAVPGFPQEAAKIPAELHGNWKLVILGFEGREIKMRDNMPHWVIQGDRVLYGGEPLTRLVVTPGTMPPIIDLCYMDNKRVYEGVYAIEGDRLKICVNQRTQGVKERPLDFGTEGQSERRLLIFQRQDPDTGDGAANSPGYIGVQYGIKPKEKTLFIAEVSPNSPAQKAGLKKDDVPLKINGTAISGIREALDPIRQARPGTEMSIRVRRDKQELDFIVRVCVVPFFLLDD
jgi:uncharacterized protein (TIGR03067 family)